MTESFTGGNVLVVDDEEPLLRAVQRLLTNAGFKVDATSGGRAAVELLEHRVFDCIVSDINMPGMSGIDLLRAARGRDLNVPVVLLTGAPSVATAAEAVEYGAFQYLMKPVEGTTLVQLVAKATRLGRMARFKREALEVLGDTGKLVGDRAGLEAAFGRALDTLWMAYQPIVRTSDGTLFAYETLVRTTEPAIPHPGALLDAAERLNRLVDLGRIIRAKSAASMDQAPEGTLLFVNLHPRDLLDEELVSPEAPLSRIASRVVLEITERASLDEVADSSARVAALRQLGFRIAIDDLGAGYAGLTSFANLEPEIVKLDMSLVRGVDNAPKKRKIIESMTRLCKEGPFLRFIGAESSRGLRSSTVANIPAPAIRAHTRMSAESSTQPVASSEVAPVLGELEESARIRERSDLLYPTGPSIRQLQRLRRTCTSSCTPARRSASFLREASAAGFGAYSARPFAPCPAQGRQTSRIVRYATRTPIVARASDARRVSEARPRTCPRLAKYAQRG